MSSNIWKSKPCLFSYRYHRIFRPVVRLMAILLPVLLWTYYYPAIAGWQFPVSWPPKAELNLSYLVLALVLAVVWLVAFGVWLVISKWYAVWFRNLAWRVSGRLGALWRWLTSGWRVAVILLLVATALMYLRYQLIGFPHKLNEFLTTAIGSKVTAVAALLAIFYWAYQARSRIVILSFTDYTGDKDLEASVTGISAHLLDKLARLSDLYRTIDEAVPIGNENKDLTETIKDKALTATISVEDIGQVLKDAVTPETKVKLGLFEVPVGPILAFVGRLVQGPRLTGSVHKEGSTLVLIGQISGGGKRGYSWRAALEDFEKPAQEGNALMPIAQISDDGKNGNSPTDPEKSAKQAALVSNETLCKLTEQLTFRIFTDLVGVGSPRWEAVRSFTEGLRLYRKTLRKEQDKKINLRKAENYFIQALADDNQFGRCHYNLGIVYRDLKETESAESAFQEAIKTSLGQTDAYYALALIYYWRERYVDALKFCNQALKVRPHEARVWDLKGMVKRKLWESQHQVLKAGEHSEVWEELIPIREIATALAWKYLCRMALRSQSVDSAIRIARTCTRNLAVAQAMIGHYGQSQALFTQAIRLPPTDTTLYFELGKTLEAVKDWQGAIEVFELVRVRELSTTDQAAYWAYFAYVQAREIDNGGKVAAVRHAYDRFLDVAAGVAANADKESLNSIMYEDSAGQKESYSVTRLKKALIIIAKNQPTSYPDFLISLAQNQGESLKNYIKRLESSLVLKVRWPFQSYPDFIKRLAQKHGESLEEYRKRLESNRVLKVNWFLPSYPGFLKWLAQIQDNSPKGYIKRLESNPDFQNFRVQKIDESFEDYIKRLEEILKFIVYRFDNYFPDLLNNLKRELSESPGDIGRLNKPLQNHQDWPWASAQIKIKLALQFLDQNKEFDQAQAYLEGAITELKKDLSSPAIKDQGLYGTLAMAYLRDGKTTEALFHAERAVALNPQRAWEHGILGDVYFAIKDYRRAEDEWNTAYNLDPTNPDTLGDIARTYWNRGVELRMSAERKETFKQVIIRFKHVLDIWQSSPISKSSESERTKQLRGRGEINYWLGRFNHELLNNDLAIFHFKVAQQQGYKPVESRLDLGWTYLKAGAHDEAEQLFREVVAELRAELPKRGDYPSDKRDDYPSKLLRKLRMFKTQPSSDDQNGDPQIDEQYGQDGDPQINELLLKTLLYSAYALAERGVRLTSAQRRIKCARLLLPLLTCKMDLALRREYHQLLRKCHGLIFLKAALLEMPLNGKKSAKLYKDAIHELEKAVAFITDGETYCHLAQAYLGYARVNQSERKPNIARARDACIHARESDLRGEYGQILDDLEKQLDQLADAKEAVLCFSWMK